MGGALRGGAWLPRGLEGVKVGDGGLACCDSWDRKESDKTG